MAGEGLHVRRIPPGGARPGRRLLAQAPEKVLALLKALIAFGGQSVPEPVLMDALWPDSEGDAGYDVLKITEIRLQRLLKEVDALEMRDATLGLNPAKCWIDALAFAALASGTDVSALEAERLPYWARW